MYYSLVGLFPYKTHRATQPKRVLYLRIYFSVLFIRTGNGSCCSLDGWMDGRQKIVNYPLYIFQMAIVIVLYNEFYSRAVELYVFCY